MLKKTKEKKWNKKNSNGFSYLPYIFLITKLVPAFCALAPLQLMQF